MTPNTDFLASKKKYISNKITSYKITVFSDMHTMHKIIPKNTIKNAFIKRHKSCTGAIDRIL